MAIYYVWSGATGSGTGATWANAFTTLTAAFVTEAAGDTLYVAHDHAEATATAITLTSSGTITNPTKVVCVNRAGSVPPVAADRRTTAQVSTTGNVNIAFGAAYTHYDGIIFICGNSTGSPLINMVLGGSWLRFDNCSMRIGSTGGVSRINVGLNVGGIYVEFNNTTVSFASATQCINMSGAFKWRDTLSALLGTIPTKLFDTNANAGGELECIGVDLSALGSGKTIVGNANSANAWAVKYRFIDCKLDASVTKSAASLAHGGIEIDFIRSGATGTNYSVHRNRISGTLDEETTIVRTGGASDGTTPIAWKVVTTANCVYSLPFECPPIAIWNDTTGSAKTATIECIWGGGAVPLDNEIWLDLEYLGSSSSPQGSFVNDGTPDLLTTPANQTTVSATWGGSTTKFKLNVTFTAQQKGWVYARVKVGKASTTAYIDPLITLT